MNYDELDRLWFQAMNESISAGEEFTRYRFAALVAAHVRKTEFKPDWANYRQGLTDGAAAEREACAIIADEHWVFGMSSAYIADAIRARGGE